MPSRQAPESQRWLEVSRDDFVHALKMLSPGRMPKSRLTQELQIGFANGEAIFSLEGALTRCPAKGQWHGVVCLAYGILVPYIQMPPPTDPVRLIFEQDRLKLEHSRFPARWMELSPWIGEMVLTAHFMGPDSPPENPLLCPSCGERAVRSRAALLEKLKRTAREEQALNLLEQHDATHVCTSCGYGWREVMLFSLVPPRA